MSSAIAAKPKPTPKAPPKVARFAEVVNGRAAMQGVLWGSIELGDVR
jgi:hypothetical protein